MIFTLPDANTTRLKPVEDATPFPGFGTNPPPAGRPLRVTQTILSPTCTRPPRWNV